MGNAVTVDAAPAGSLSDVANLSVAQGSTTSGQNGVLMEGAVTTGAPTYTTGQTSPLSLATTGNLRVVTQANATVNLSQVAGTTTDTNSGTISAGSIRIVQGGAATGTKTNVASSGSSVTILAANTARKGAMVYNDSTQILYLDLSGGTASTSSYSTQVPSQSLFELPGPTLYNGAITGIWASANGNARVTEFS